MTFICDWVKSIKKPKELTPYDFAIMEIGMKEIKGSKHNKRVLEYHDTTGDFGADEIPWCSSFMNWCEIQPYWNAEKNYYIDGDVYFYPDHKGMSALARAVGTGSGMARSWLKWGKSVPLKDAKKGDKCIYWRVSPDAETGHVHMFDHIDGEFIYGVGGNQSDAVNISPYPISRLLDIRRAV